MKRRKNRCTGFPSPADDYKKANLSLDDLLIQHPTATYFLRMKGNAMLHAGIHDEDVLVVDRSVFPPQYGDIIVAEINREYLVRKYMPEGDAIWLRAAHPDVPSTRISSDAELVVWGVVTVVLHFPV